MRERSHWRCMVAGRHHVFFIVAMTLVCAFATACGGGRSSMTSSQTPLSAPSISLSANALNFGNQKVGVSSAPQSFTVTNTGSAVLNISGVTVSGDFAQANNCGANLASGASCTVNITFTPRTTGTQDGSIAISNNAAGSPQGITLTGIGVVPTMAVSTLKTFSDQMVGTISAPQTLTVNNTSTVAALIASITATGDFAITHNCGVLLPAASCAINVTFAPTSGGSRMGTITVIDDALASPQQIAVNGNGIAVNTPIGTNIVAHPVDSSGNSTPFTLLFEDVHQPGNTIVATTASGQLPQGYAGGSSFYDLNTNAVFFGMVKVCVNYAGLTLTRTSSPQLLHYENNLEWVDRTESIDSAAKTVCGRVSSFSPFAIAQPIPIAELSVTSLDFGAVRRGLSSDPGSTITIRNIGKDNLNVPTFSFQGSDADDFSVTFATATQPIHAGESASWTVRFKPSSTEDESATLIFGTDDGSRNVTLRGKGIFPSAVVSPLASFGAVRNGEALTQTVSITNEGTDFLNLPTFKTDGANAADFTVTPANPTGNIPPGSAASWDVTFFPTTSLDEIATLVFMTDNGPISIDLKGTGIGLSSLSISPQNPSIALGGSPHFTATGTFSNNTTQDLTNSVTWSSSAPKVATIDSHGVATLLAEGATVITARKGNVTASTLLTVAASLRISNISALPTSNSVSITWTTNVPADSSVTYGANAGASDNALATTHSISVANLSPSTSYVYRVNSRDAAGNSATSRSFTFTTTAAGTSLVPYRIGWTELPNTKLNAVCPHDSPDYPFSKNCFQVVGAWSGGIADIARNRLIIWGGGHNDYFGNELYFLDLADQKLKRLNDPSPIATGTKDVELSDHTPNSRHTYGGLAHLAHADRMFVYGGSPATSGAGFASTDTWSLDLATLLWKRVDSPTTPGPLGNDFGVVSDYDPNTQTVFVHDNKKFWQYTDEARSYKELASSTISIYNSAVIDPKRKLFFIIGGQNPKTSAADVIQVIDISRSNNYSLQDWHTSGCGALPNAGYPGVAYDPVLDRIVGWVGGNTVYIFNPDTKSCTTNLPANGPGPQQTNGTHGRFRYFPGIDAFVVVNDANQNAYVLKLSSAPGPAIKNVASESGLATATIRWDTDAPATSQIEYGTTDDLGVFSIFDASLVSNHSQTLTGLKPGTSYSYRLHSTNGDGIESVESIFFFTTQLDTTPPEISLISPASGQVSGVTVLAANATDEFGVAGVQFYVDGAPVGAEQLGPGPIYSFSWNSAAVKNGPHTVTAQARDTAGNPALSTPQAIMTFNQIPASEFEKRCQSGGVIRCWDFEDPSATAVHLLPPPNSDLRGEIVSDVVGDGAGALRFTVPSQSGPDTSGSFSLNFSDDLSRQFGEGEEFYLQYKVRYNDVMVNTRFDGSDGFKMHIAGEGDRPDFTAFSCTTLELPLQNIQQFGFPRAYHSCNLFRELQVQIPNSDPVDFLDQNAAGCAHYRQSTEPPCFKYKANQWMSVQQHVKIGHWGTPDSTVEFWAADEGQSSRLIISLADFTLVNDNPDQSKYGKIWLLPYQTGKDPTQVTETGYVWYDSLIISTRRIPDPDVSTPNAPDLLRAVSTSPGSMDLTWRSNSYGTEQGFAIERCDDLANTCMASQNRFVPVATVESKETSFHDADLNSGQTYTYRVRAVGNSNDYSAYSGGACFTGANPCYSQDVAK